MQKGDIKVQKHFTLILAITVCLTGLQSCNEPEPVPPPTPRDSDQNERPTPPPPPR